MVRLFLILDIIPASPTNLLNRHYVAEHYWPNKEAAGTKLHEMYKKLMAATNASSNGK